MLRCDASASNRKGECGGGVVTANPPVHFGHFFVGQSGSGLELKERLEYGGCAYTPLRVVLCKESGGAFFFFEIPNGFYVTTTVT